MNIAVRAANRLPIHSRAAVRGTAALLAVLLAIRSALGVDWPNPDSLLAPDGAAHIWLALALVLVAHGLARGAREAWTLLSLACLADLGVVVGARAPLSVVLSLTLALAFLLGRGQFTVRCPTPARRLGYLAVAAALGGAWFLPLDQTLGALALQGALMLAGTGGLLVLLRPAAPLPNGAARLAVSRALAAVRPIEQLEDGARQVSAAQRQASNPIWGYALESDKAHFASTQWPGGVAYRVRAGVALAVGEPIGPAHARLGMAAEFVEYCRAHGLLPAFYQVRETDIDSYRDVGLRALKIGEEAMIDVPAFSLVGKRIANVRHCVTHVERAGLRAEVYPRGVFDETTLDGIVRVSDAWMAAQPGRGEMGFSMGGFDRAALYHTCTVVARDTGGVVHAFITFRSVGAERVMVLDLMRRGPAAPSGTIDFLIACALERFRADGVSFASLSLAPLARAREDGRSPRVGSLLALWYEKGNSLYRYKSLFSFKNKFAPRWEPRYLLYPRRPLALPRVALAVALVHVPRGALRPPHPGTLARGFWRMIRGCLDWRHGLEPCALRRTLWLMTWVTLIAAVPELWRAIALFGHHSVATPYAMFSLALVACNILGAARLALHLKGGRGLLALGALGFFIQASWGLAAGYAGGWFGWGIYLGLAPVEAWMIWFLCQPEVRAQVRTTRRH